MLGAHIQPMGESTARLALLRLALAELGIQGFFVPLADAFQSEYPPASERRLEWLTGFSGSAGMAVVLAEDAFDSYKAGKWGSIIPAAVFTDGRYTLQVRDEVDETLFQCLPLKPGMIAEWLGQCLKPGSKIGFDAKLHTVAQMESMCAALDCAGIELVPLAENPIDALWHNRPHAPASEVEWHDDAYAGQPSREKIAHVQQALETHSADYALVSSPESIAWLLNIRARDIPSVPVALSYALVDLNGHVLWGIDEKRVPSQVRMKLGNDVAFLSPVEFAATLARLGQENARVLCDKARDSFYLHQALHGAHIIAGQDPCILPKAVKNAVEVQGARNAHLRDGVAMVEFLHWLDNAAPSGKVTELKAEEELLGWRKKQAHFVSPSFDTIAGAGAHGAIVHYRASQKTNAVLEKNSLFLLDSGGQYRDGTTDITRTLAIGEASPEHKRHFTLVLKGHIRLARAVFPQGTTGQQLDSLARFDLWQHGLDYAHGTGHGVGSFLSVHEGPQGIHGRPSVPLEAGMILSNEPGYYAEGAYGIRIENLVVVQPAEKRGFLRFETLTLAPIDTRLVEVALLTEEERRWLNQYHARVYEALAPLVQKETAEWLRLATLAL